MAFIPPEKYKDIMESMPILCVDLILEKDGKILTLLRKNAPLKNHYWIPGGRVLKNETLRDAVKRKAKEECGLLVEVEKELGTYELIDENGIFEDLKTGTHTVSVVFKVNLVKHQEVKFDEHHLDFEWIDKNNLPPELDKMIGKLEF